MTGFADDLAAEFGISDRDELFLMLERLGRTHELANNVSRGRQWAEEEADALDFLEKVLWPTVCRLRKLEYLLAKALAEFEQAANVELPQADKNHNHEQLSIQTERNRNQIYEITEQLAKYARLAPTLPRLRREQGQRQIRFGNSERAFHFDIEPLRALMDEVAYYWTVTLGRRFGQDQQAWRFDGDGLPVPTEKATDAVRFSFKVMDHIAPGSGGYLKTRARNYTSKKKAT